MLDVTDGHDLRRWADRISRRPMPDSTAQERAGRSVLREVISRVPPGQGLADIADPALPPSDREALGAFKGYVVRTCRPTLLETIGTHPRRSP